MLYCVFRHVFSLNCCYVIFPSSDDLSCWLKKKIQFKNNLLMSNIADDETNFGLDT